MYTVGTCMDSWLLYYRGDLYSGAAVKRVSNHLHVLHRLSAGTIIVLFKIENSHFVVAGEGELTSQDMSSCTA